MIVQAEEQHGQGISLRLVECRQETGTPHDHESAGVAHDVHEVMTAGITPPRMTTSTARYWSTLLNNR